MMHDETLGYMRWHPQISNKQFHQDTPQRVTSFFLKNPYINFIFLSPVYLEESEHLKMANI